MTPPPWSDILALHLNRGRDAAVTIGQLQERLGVNRRIVERAIESLRENGRPICSDASGIWIADTADEVRACADRLNRRLVTQYRTVRAMRQTAQRMRAPTLVQQDLGLR